ncbi:antitoxin Xre/MbcA/ParS toxin-binding domain-containing protein [Mangrovicoccus algicola]|nr:antitoxin Xre/MbcA/ParS toxin-binding domain-containing protein [Mangrovicoccus algicola]
MTGPALPPAPEAAPLMRDARIEARMRDAREVEVALTLTASDLPAQAADALQGRLADRLEAALSREFGQLVAAYRARLEEQLAKGQDAALREALNRVRLQTGVLAGLPMADQAEACELLGLSLANPSATMRRKEQKGEILRFTLEGRARYPLFQFDAEAQRLHPAMSAILAERPAGWSDFRLLYWLTRPHRALGDATPAARLGRDPGAVLAAFRDAAEPADHG